MINGRHYLAVFHWLEKEEETTVDLERAQLQPGTVWKELWSKKTMQDEHGILRWNVCGCDASDIGKRNGLSFATRIRQGSEKGI